MTCDDLHSLLHGYVDGELDLVRHLDIERHLAGCPNCSQACERLQALRVALRDESFRFPPPAGLRRRIEASLRDRDAIRRPRPWGWLAVAAAAALLVIGTGILARFWPAAADDRLESELVSSHVRSLMLEGHLYDVKSSDQHTVKPWFHGKIDFAPSVANFAKEDFPLDGGRLDYLDNRVVAALIYHRRKHTINLFIWPSPRTADMGPSGLTRQGYQLIHWSRGGMTYWAVSDLNAAELRSFADLVIAQTPPTTP